MQITLRLFAGLRETVQAPEFILEAAQALSCEQAMDQLAARHPDTSGILRQCAVAKNGVFVRRDTLLAHGDELAILPPASGG